RMDMLFTHFGLSGPAVLRCSQFVVKELKKSENQEVLMAIDSLPDKKGEEIFQEISQWVKENPKKSIKNILKGYLPERYLHFLLKKNDLDPQIQGANISSEKIRSFAKSCKQF